MDNDRRIDAIRIFRNYIFVATIPDNPNINTSLEAANPKFLMIWLHKIWLISKTRQHFLKSVISVGDDSFYQMGQMGLIKKAL